MENELIRQDIEFIENVGFFNMNRTWQEDREEACPRGYGEGRIMVSKDELLSIPSRRCLMGDCFSISGFEKARGQEWMKYLASQGLTKIQWKIGVIEDSDLDTWDYISWGTSGDSRPEKTVAKTSTS